MQLTKEAVRVQLAIKLAELDCTVEDAEHFLQQAVREKRAIDYTGASKALLGVGAVTAIAPGVASGLAGYKMWDSARSQDSKHQKKLEETQQYRQARKDLQAAAAQPPSM